MSEFCFSGWFVGPRTQPADQSAVCGARRPVGRHGHAARLRGPVVPQPVPLPAPLLLHHPHKVS